MSIRPSHRSPLQTLQLTARALKLHHAESDVGDAADRQIRSYVRMQKLLDDLTDFNRAEHGLGIGVSPRPVDLGPVCEEELQQIRAIHGERPLQLEISGDCHGVWDPARIQQLLNNLVTSAWASISPARSPRRMGARSSPTRRTIKPYSP